MMENNDKKNGFTLIETIVAVSVSTLVLLTVVGFVYYFYRTNNYNLNQMSAVNSARRGMEVMVKEIREATYSAEGAYPIKDIQEQSFTFYSDIDKDLNIERVRYFLEGSVLKKGVTEPDEYTGQYFDEDEDIKNLSVNVRNGSEDVFTYFNSENSQIEDLGVLTEIKLVQIKLVINADSNRPPGEFTLVSNTQLRNLKEE